MCDVGLYINRLPVRCGHRGDGIGETGAALVVADHAGKRGQLAHEASIPDRLPLGVEVRHESRHEDQVDRPFADDLVRDVPCPAPGIARFGAHDATPGGGECRP
jgi:hypothetical protein